MIGVGRWLWVLVVVWWVVFMVCRVCCVVCNSLLMVVELFYLNVGWCVLCVVRGVLLVSCWLLFVVSCVVAFGGLCLMFVFFL